MGLLNCHYSFCGIEIAAVHLQDSKVQSFTKAIAISVLIIFFTMLFGALTLAMLIPIRQLNFISGIPEVVQLFFAQIQLKKIALPINLLVVIGCIGCANNWLLAPVKGLLFASQDYNLINTSSLRLLSPRKLLLIQAWGVSLISTLFLFLPAINASYWLMLTLATQMYLLMYLLNVYRSD